MTRCAKFGSLLALALVIGPAGLYFLGQIELPGVKAATLAGTILWFVATPRWMGRKLPVDADQVEI
jgi:hypothetical protein